MRFFYISASNRKRQNHISFFKNDQEDWIYNQNDLLDYTLAHFNTVFTTNHEATHWSNIKLSSTNFEKLDMLDLNKPLHDSEINSAIFSFKPLKSPGPDGLHPFFIRNIGILLETPWETFVTKSLMTAQFLLKSTRLIYV